MTKWIEPQPVEVSQSLRTAVGGHPLVARTLARRGFSDVGAACAFLDPQHYRPAPPADLPNLIKAAERLEQAILRKEKICIWGDFDVDGQTSTTLLVSTLQDLGAITEYHIPNRERESHGVNLPVLKRLIAEGIDLVLTCDTGVTAHEPIAYAQAQGVTTIITDHHDLPASLPAAYAVVNPKMLPRQHPLRELPGVGCVYKLIEALYEQAGQPEAAAQHLDLVALGIVADVATQTRDTRYLLQRGLEVLRRTERLGLRTLMEVAELDPQRLTEEHIGFELAPRLNALGRLADATVAVEFLTTEDLARARILAAELDGLNARRKMLCDQVAKAAEKQIERDPSLLEQKALVLSRRKWPAGVIGIVAGRLAEKYHRPTILITIPSEEALARGSARSVEGCDISAAIAAHGEMLEGFGGHPMAAGLAIEPERIPEFRHALLRDPGGFLKPPGSKALQIDGYLPLAELSLDLVEQLERLAPFGPGNPALTLASKELSLKSHSEIGRTGEHLRLIVEDDEGAAQKVIWWRGAGAPLPQGRFDLAYTVRASDFRGQRSVQIEWVDARDKSPIPQLKPEAVQPQVRVVDYRRQTALRGMLERLQAQEEDILVWSEADARMEATGRDRRTLEAAEVMAIWTTPPGPVELRLALERVSPEVVYLFGVDPGLRRPSQFLERLAGLAKRTLSSNRGRFEISALAAATAQREATVRAGLDWLSAQGHLAILEERDGEVHLEAGDGEPRADAPRSAARLKALLEETAAYRAHFARVSAEKLVKGE